MRITTNIKNCKANHLHMITFFLKNNHDVRVTWEKGTFSREKQNLSVELNDLYLNGDSKEGKFKRDILSQLKSIIISIGDDELDTKHEVENFIIYDEKSSFNMVRKIPIIVF